METHIDIDPDSEEARAARTQILDLVAAYRGCKSTYMPALEALLNGLLRPGSDPTTLSRRLANVMDGAALLAFALASALAEIQQTDIPGVLRTLDQAIDGRIELDRSEP
jgi:hypothetical protein